MTSIRCKNKTERRSPKQECQLGQQQHEMHRDDPQLEQQQDVKMKEMTPHSRLIL